MNRPKRLVCSVCNTVIQKGEAIHYSGGFDMPPQHDTCVRQSETPSTDTFVEQFSGSSKDLSDFARTLERELSAARAQLESERFTSNDQVKQRDTEIINLRAQLAERDAEIKNLRSQLVPQSATINALRDAIRWALGYDVGEPDFRPRGDGDGAYWWRKELRRRADLAPGIALDAIRHEPKLDERDATIARLRADAERYQWLRDEAHDSDWRRLSMVTREDTDSTLDGLRNYRDTARRETSQSALDAENALELGLDYEPEKSK